MAMRTDQFESDGTETALAKVLTPARYEKSLYVQVPKIGKDRRTDGGATDMTSHSVTFAEEIDTYKRGDYVLLTFEPSKFGDDHELVHVKKSSFTEPINVDEPKFPNTKIPKTCPQCGRKAAAVIKTEYDTMTGGKVSDTADYCIVEEDNRGAWFDLTGEHAFVHGVEK